MSDKITLGQKIDFFRTIFYLRTVKQYSDLVQVLEESTKMAAMSFDSAYVTLSEIKNRRYGELASVGDPVIFSFIRVNFDALYDGIKLLKQKGH